MLSYAPPARPLRSAVRLSGPARSVKKSAGSQLVAQAMAGAEGDLVYRIGVQTHLHSQIRRCHVAHQQCEEDRSLTDAKSVIHDSTDRLGKFLSFSVHVRVGVCLDQLVVVFHR